MTIDVLCLRPEADFQRAGALAPATLNVAYRAPDAQDVPQLMKSARALLIPAVGPKLAPVLFEGTAVKLVQITGAGLDRLDQATLTRLGIPVCNVPGGSNSAVAEYVVTAASTLLRRFAWADAEIKRGNYESFRARMIADNLAGLDGLTVGVVGLGTIGLAVARAFRHAGAHIVYYDTAARDPQAITEIGAKSVAIDDLFRQSDVVTLHVPLLDATRNLVGARELALMKPTAVLVNAARGGVVDESALVAALGAGKLGGAAVDVYSTEPPPASNPLVAATGEAAQRLLLTPHIAGVMRQSAAFLFRESWTNIERALLKGEAPLNRAY